MNLEFFLPSNKLSAKKKLSIPANIIENLLTNRQNRAVVDDSLLNDSNHHQASIPDSKYMVIIRENKQLREENQRLRDVIQSMKEEKEKEKNGNKQSLANLLLSISYEKQEDNNCYRNTSNEINLIDDSDNSTYLKSYCNTDGNAFSNCEHTSNSNGHFTVNELNSIIKRTKRLLNKYKGNALQSKQMPRKLDQS